MPILDDDGNVVEEQPRHILNEAMVAERDPSTLSIYRLNVDGQNLGKFRSSGIIVSSGTGSTAWLYSAKRITAKSVNQVKKHINTMGFDIKYDAEKPSIDDFRLARKINRQTAFPCDQENIYYFVREGFQETNISEGFCHEI